MTTKPSLLLTITIVCFIAAFSPKAQAQGTPFTYQGRLNSGTNVATGSYDLRFALFDAVTAGTQQGNLLTNTATGVSNGLFTVTLDFGNQFPGAPRWLEIGVRSNSVDTFQTLTPRQPLTPVPYAVFAESASATNLLGTIPVGSLSGVALLSGSNILSAPETVTGNAPGVASGSSIDPSVFIHVNNSATDGTLTSPDYAGIGFGNNSTRQAIVGGTFGNDFLDFYTGGSLTSPKMRIDFAGNISVQSGNVSVPTGSVRIGSTFSSTTKLSIDQPGGVTQLELLKPGSNLGYQFATDANGLGICEHNIACGRFYIQNGTGNIGIGTASPTNKLDVQGSADFMGRVGVGTTSPKTDLHVVASQYGALPAALFESANCGLPCGQQDYQENIRLLNSNPNGQTGIGFLTAAGSALTNVPTAWIGTQYGCCSGNASDLKFATRPSTNLVDRLFINGISGNVGIGTNSPSTKLEVAGEVTCVAVNITSDRNAKEEFKPVNPREVLAKVVGLPITEWQYKSQADARHIGPMAQDFREAFTLGHDEKHIATVDEGGVALAAIQGLNQKLEEKDARIQAQSVEIQSLNQSLSQLKKLVEELGEKVSKTSVH